MTDDMLTKLMDIIKEINTVLEIQEKRIAMLERKVLK